MYTVAYFEEALMTCCDMEKPGILPEMVLLAAQNPSTSYNDTTGLKQCICTL